MSDEQHQNESTMGERISPGLEVAIQNWQKARVAFQNNRVNENRDCYVLRCDELGQSIGSWARSEPELAFEFGSWFRSHEAEWASNCE